MRIATISFISLLFLCSGTAWACGDEAVEVPASAVPVTQVTSAASAPLTFAERTLPDVGFAVLETREDGALALRYPGRHYDASF